MVHGDIKPSNIMITSFNHLMLTDQLPFKPAFISGDDLKTYNFYFGELDNNQRCYIAPERFKSDISEAQFDQNLLETSMDIFSAGCVIAEIFMDRKDGRALFDLA
jgi:phosphoinositide-3-kinase regulatory subunit 4